LGPETAGIIARSLAPRLRPEDAAECAALGLSPYHSVNGSILESVLSYGAFERGECVAAWGFTSSSPCFTDSSLIEITVYPWLLTTSAVDRNKKTFLKANQEFIDVVNSKYPILETWVHAEYTKALRWLGHLGFVIEPSAPFGPLQKQFCRVVRRVMQ
jgi:hypothetical protein